jgi:SNF2 family DNA or RNA helicase
MSEAFEELAAGVDYLVDGSGTPTPNDLSELFFHLHIMNPNKFPARKEFLKKYGKLHKGEKTVVKEAVVLTLREEIEKCVFSQDLELEAKKYEHEVKVELTPEQKNLIFEAEEAYRSKEITNALMRDFRQANAVNHTEAANNGKVTALREAIAQHRTARGDSSKMLIFADDYKGIDVVMEGIGVPKDEVVMITGQDPETRRQVTPAMRELVKDHFNLGVKTFKEKYRGMLASETSSAREKRRAKKALKYIEGKKDARFCILSPAGATGLNLQTANGVILYNISDTAGVEDQKIRRAYRKGVEHDVDVYKLHTETPLEIRALHRLKEKHRVGELIGNVEDTARLFG